MKKIVLLAGLLALPMVGSAQSASATVDLRLNLPVIVPQLVVVSPGVQVVPEVDEEVFFVDGFYWCRHDGGWYRSRAVRGGWVAMPVRAVPVRLVQLPPGHYKRWKAAKAERRHHEEHEHHDHDHDRDHDRGEGRGHGKHGKHGRHD